MTDLELDAIRERACVALRDWDAEDFAEVARAVPLLCNEIDRLRAALKPFAHIAYTDEPDETPIRTTVCAGWVREAREGLREGSEG